MFLFVKAAFLQAVINRPCQRPPLMPAGYQSQRALGPFLTRHNICSFYCLLCFMKQQEYRILLFFDSELLLWLRANINLTLPFPLQLETRKQWQGGGFPRLSAFQWGSSQRQSASAHINKEEQRRRGRPCALCLVEIKCSFPP